MTLEDLKENNRAWAARMVARPLAAAASTLAPVIRRRRENLMRLQLLPGERDNIEAGCVPSLTLRRLGAYASTHLVAR